MSKPSKPWKAAPAGKKWRFKCRMLNGLENFVDPAIVPLSERKDLPKEAKDLLFSAGNIIEKGGKGGLASSRWCRSSNPGTTSSSSPAAIPSCPPKALLIPPSSASTPPRAIPTLNPEAIEVKPETALDLDPKVNDFVLNNNSKLDPEVTEVNFQKDLTLDADVKESTLEAHPTLDPEAKEFTLSTHSTPDPQALEIALDTAFCPGPQAQEFTLDTVPFLDYQAQEFIFVSVPYLNREAQEFTIKTHSSTLDPEASEFLFDTVSLLGYQAQEFATKTHSLTLDPEANEFIIDTVCSLDTKPKAFSLEIQDLDVVSLHSETKEIKLEAKDLNVISSLESEVEAYSPKVQKLNTEAKEACLGVKKVKLEAKYLKPAKMTPLTGTTELSTPASKNGLTTSRWAQLSDSPPTCDDATSKSPVDHPPTDDSQTANSAAVKKLATSDVSAMTPLKAKDVPVHLRQYYIPPHLRPVGQKASPGRPILPYIEPHQRVGILPEVVPNDANLQPYNVPPNSLVSASPKSNTPDSKSSTPTSAKKSSFLATTFEEFRGDKAHVPVPASEKSKNQDTKPSTPITGEKTPFLATTFEEFRGDKAHVPVSTSEKSKSQDTKSSTSIPGKKMPFLATNFEEFRGHKAYVPALKEPKIQDTMSSTSTPIKETPFFASTLEKVTGSKVPVPVPASEKSKNQDTKSSTSTSNKKMPFLASSFDEFGGREVQVPAFQNSVTRQCGPLVPITNAISRSIQLPPDCFSTKLAANRGVPNMEKKVSLNENVKKENMIKGATWSVQEAKFSITGKKSRLSVGEKIEEAKQPDLVQPMIYSTPKMPAVDANVHQTHEYVQDFEEVILFEIRNHQPPLVGLTREALIQETGAAPKDSPSNEFEDFVSDDGIDATAAFEETKPVDSRGYLAEVDNSLQQHDGNWMPVPIDWETDRSGFKGAFIPEYITTWARTVPASRGKFDIDCENFSSGLWPLSLLRFENPVGQPLCYPSISHSSNIHKQLNQCSDIDSKKFTHKGLRKQYIRERRAEISAQQLASCEEQEEIIVNPNIPKIAIHLRPAQLKDVPGITSIYNHYVLNTIIPEDQTPVSEEHIKAVLVDASEQALPFVVAIKGPAPEGGRTSHAEEVIGYAHTDFHNYGHGGKHSGRSRFTGVVELYVEPKHTRKGVGRSLMDRILLCSSYSHSTKEGYSWINPNPKDGPIYGQQGGAQHFHQLFFHRPIEEKEDPDHQWLKQWLHSKFFIEEAAHLRSVARTCNRGTEARFLDLLTFQFEAAAPGAFDITH